MKKPALLLGLLILTIFLSGCINPPTPECGNLICEANENCENCSADCGVCPTECGNGKCETGETPQNCPTDCTEPVQCGNLECDADETCENCAVDCLWPEYGCGNRVCQTQETETNCPQDCSTEQECAEEGKKVYYKPEFGPTVCCNSQECIDESCDTDTGIKISSFLDTATGQCISPDDGSLGTCIQGWWQNCPNETCEPSLGENQCNCPKDCMLLECSNYSKIADVDGDLFVTESDVALLEQIVRGEVAKATAPNGCLCGDIDLDGTITMEDVEFAREIINSPLESKYCADLASEFEIEGIWGADEDTGTIVGDSTVIVR